MLLQTADTTTVVGSSDTVLSRRIRAEFTEMPGLKLTLPQATRLFGADARRCQEALGRLVDAGAISFVDGVFVRAEGGRRNA